MPTRKPHHRTKPVTPIQRRRVKHTVKTRPLNDSELSRFRQNLVLALVVLLGIECSALAFTSPWLEIHRVELRGVAGLAPQEIEAAQNAVGLPPNTNFFRVPAAALQNRLRALPAIQTAVLVRHFPDGLEAKISVRQPIAIIERDGQSFEADPTGVAIRLARPELIRRLPHVFAPAGTPLTLGEVSGNVSVNTAVQVVDRLRGEAAGGIAKIDIDSAGNLCLNMQDGVKVCLGSTDEMPAKLDQLRRLYRHDPALSERLSQVNLTVPDYPACVLRSSFHANLGEQDG